jgi:uncharacterized protein (DUF362 family)/Pyruvate/2-oxoacid:ferredoxin oxidoreductase delta subunit
MEKNVSIVQCPSYDKAAEGVHQALELLGGIGRFVRPGDLVVIKPNMVAKKHPKEAATTHPAVVRAVIREVEQAGGRVVIAESPGGPYHAGILKSLYTGCGMHEAVQGTGAELNFDTGFEEVHFPEGETVKKFPVISPVLKADVIISLPKFKTHAMTSYTGAVKNLFGVIPGTYKAEMHFRLGERSAFCSMLVDLHECIRPHLSVMDGIWGMEGNGPTAGENRNIGLILASANAHALDLAACHLIGYRPEEVDTVRNAIDRGLVPASAAELTVLGESLKQHVMDDFKKPESHFNLLRVVPLPTAVNAKLTDWLSSRPAIDERECVGCGECARCCPPQAISMEGEKPRIHPEKCIRCFCCQELCPQKAVKIHRPWLNRAMLKFFK